MAGREIEGHAADCLILKNEEEIATLQFASSKIQDNDLRQAAQKMIQDHQQAISKLGRFAAHAGEAGNQANSSGGARAAGTARSGAAAGNTTGASGTAITSRDTKRSQSREALRVGTDDRANASAGGASSQEVMYQVARREKEECLKMTQADLSKHEGAKFDKALVGQQSVAHTNMLAKLRALQSQGSSEFEQVLQELEKTAQQHKQHLDETMERLSLKAESGKARS
jgi:hypothetical protein